METGNDHKMKFSGHLDCGNWPFSMINADHLKIWESNQELEEKNLTISEPKQKQAYLLTDQTYAKSSSITLFPAF